MLLAVLNISDNTLYMCIAQVGLKRDVTPQATEPPPTAHDEQAKPAEGEEPVAMRTNTSGDIEAGNCLVGGMTLGKGRHSACMVMVLRFVHSITHTMYQ